MRKRSVLNSPHLEELKKKRRKATRNKTLAFVFLFLAISVGLGYLLRWQKINIQSVQISGNGVLDTTAIEEVARENLAGNFLWFIPKTNFLLYPRGTIATALADKFKILKDISIGLEQDGVLNINVTEREAKYTWCGEELSLESEKNKCYFIESNGYVFDQAPYFSGDVYFKFYGKLEGEKNEPIGSYFLPDFFSKLVSLKDMMSRIGVKVSSLVVSSDGEVDLYLSTITPPPDAPKIIFKLNADFEKIVENLQTALSSEPLQADFKKKYSSLNYIDLRFGNKVYFKFK